MTWNELIHELNQIPECRREEKAIFLMRDEEGNPETGLTIDSKEEIDLGELNIDSDAGNDNDDTTFVIAG